MIKGATEQIKLARKNDMLSTPEPLTFEDRLQLIERALMMLKTPTGSLPNLEEFKKTEAHLSQIKLQIEA